MLRLRKNKSGYADVGGFIALIVGSVIAIFIGVALFNPVNEQVNAANVTNGSAEQATLGLVPLLYIVMIVLFVVAGAMSILKGTQHST